MSSDKCGSTDTQSGEPCSMTGKYSDGRCIYHTDDPEAESPKLDRGDKVNFRLAEAAHSRLQSHQRQGETLSGTVGRALDALEREGDLPDAVELAMKGRLSTDGAADVTVEDA